MEKQITALEERLRLAMLNSDVATLDELISPKLLFTNHLGMLISKEQDLDAHRSGALEIRSINLSEIRIMPFSDAAIVSAKTEIVGRYAGQEANGTFRFTRVWSSDSGNWQVVAGHSCLLA